MIAFGHTAIGSATGLLIYQVTQGANPFLNTAQALVLGIVLHYISDLIPHGHFFRINEFKKKIVYAILFDFLLSILLFLTASYLNFGLGIKLLLVTAGILGSQLPDILDGLIYSTFLKNKGILQKENAFHNKIHWHGVGEKTLLLGKRDLWQIGVVVASFLYTILSN